jgi:hypothetical protein
MLLHAVGEVLPDLCEIICRQVMILRRRHGFLLQSDFTPVIHSNLGIKGIRGPCCIRTGFVSA